MSNDNSLSFVSESLFIKLADGVSCQTICEQGRVKDVFFIDGKMWVMTSSVGSGKGTGYTEVSGYQIVYLEHYSGNLNPLDYAAHSMEVSVGNRARGYGYMKVKFGKKEIVFLPVKRCFKPTSTGSQLSLF